MGSGSSKVEWVAPDQPQPAQSTQWYDGPTPMKPKHKRVNTLPINASRNRPVPVRSQSLTSKPVLAGVREIRDPAVSPAFTTDDGRYIFDPRYNMPFAEHGQLRPVTQNPLPTPPKDMFGNLRKPLPQYSRVPSMYPAAFIPISPDELKRSKTVQKKKSKGKLGTLFAHRSEPSSSTTSHSSASTSNPPPQVIIPLISDDGSPRPPFLSHSRSVSHSHSRSGTVSTLPTPTLTTHQQKKQKKKKNAYARFLAGFAAMFSSKSPKPKDKGKAKADTPPPRHPVPLIPNMDPALNVAPRPISPPFNLTPRTLPPAPAAPPIRFYHPNDPHYAFTTFSPHTVFYKKKLYHTAEHLYQCMKFFPEKGIEGGDPQVAENIRTGSDYPKDAVIVGRKEIGKARANWKEARVFAMDEILYHKFSQHPDLRAELVATIPSELILDSPADPFWGVGKNAEGRNELGKALMRARDRFQREMGM